MLEDPQPLAASRLCDRDRSTQIFKVIATHRPPTGKRGHPLPQGTRPARVDSFGSAERGNAQLGGHCGGLDHARNFRLSSRAI